MKLYYLAATALLSFFSVGISGFAQPSSNAAQYLNAALDLMQSYSLHRKEIDWPALRKQAFTYARDAKVTQETYPAIVFACTQLKVNQGTCLQQPHGTPIAIQLQTTTILRAAEEASHGRPLTPPSISPFFGRDSFSLAMLRHADKKYAYLVVTTAMGSHAESLNPRYRHRWAETLYSLVNKGIQAGAQGWILDLRGQNKWASFAPIFAGLQPLFGNGTILKFRSPKSSHTTSIKDGTILEQVRFANPYVEERIDEALSYTPKDSPLAVLIDRETQGAAEVFAVALKGRPKTCFIGQRTGGFTDSGAGWPLADGALLDIVTEQVFDRNGHAYPEGVEPNLERNNLSKIPAIASDPAIIAAQNWLATQNK